MNGSRPPTQPPAPLPETLARATQTAEDWRDKWQAEHERAERLHVALNHIAALTATGRSNPDAALDEIGITARRALRGTR